MASNPASSPTPAPLLIREKQLPQLLAMSRAQVRALLAGRRFPRPIRLGKRCIAWRYADITAWVSGGCGLVEGEGGR